MSSQLSVAVIGAGPAGLTAAFRLHRAGAKVTVLEEREWVGGRTRTDEVEGVRIDAATQLFGSMYSRFFRVLREAGAGELALRSSGRDALLRDGRVHEVVYGSVASMLTSGGLPLGTKIRLGTTYVPFLSRHADALQMDALERAAGAGLDRESIAAWGHREIGRDFVEYLVAPLLGAYYGARPEETSGGLYHALARSGMDVSVYGLRGGASGYCEQLAVEVRGRGEVRTGVRVSRVERDGEGVRIAWEGGEERFDRCVVAVPAPVSRALLGGAFPTLDRWLAAVRYRPAASVALLLAGPVGVRYFGLSFPRDEARGVAALCIEENKAGVELPPGRGLLVCFPTPEAAEELLDAEPNALLERVLPDVERALPGVGARIRRAKIYRWKEGHALFYPGYLTHLAALRRGEVERDEAIVLAGDYLHQPTVEGAVHSGLDAAERITRS